MGLFGKKNQYDQKRFENNTKIFQQQLLDLTKQVYATKVVKVRLENIIALLDTFVSGVSFRDMEVFDGYFFNGLAALKDSIALNLNEAVDYSLTSLQNLIISNRNQGRLMVLVEEIKGQVQNIRDYMNIDQNQQAIEKTNTRLIEIKQISEKKGNSMPQAERDNLTREVSALLNRRTSYLTRNRYLLDSIRARENQIDALQTKKQYESMVATQLMKPEQFKDIVADITLAQDTLDQAQEEMTNISETMYDTNTSKKDARVLSNSLVDLLKDVESIPSKTKETATIVAEEKEDTNELNKILEDFEV
jgi:hypothetical protein